MADQQQAILQQLAGFHRLQVADIILRPGELQQFGDNQPDALHLLVDQPDLVLDRLGTRPEHIAQHIEVALDDGDRVVDFVRHAGRQLADGGQLLVHHQLRLGGLEVGHRLLQLCRARRHLGIERGAPALQRIGLGLQLVEQAVEVGGHDAQLVLPGHRADAGIVVTQFDGRHRRMHALDGLEHPARREDGIGAGQQHGQHEEGGHGIEGVPAGLGERGFEKADVEHADTLLPAIDQRRIGRHIPVADHEGAVQPGHALLEHRIVHHRRYPGTDGPRIAEQPHIGRHPHVAEEQRCRPGAAQRQGAVRIDDGIQVVDEIQILVEQHAPFEHTEQVAGGIVHRRRRVDDQATLLRCALGRHGIGRGDQRGGRTAGQ